MVNSGRPVLDRLDGQDQQRAWRGARRVVEFLTAGVCAHPFEAGGRRPARAQAERRAFDRAFASCDAGHGAARALRLHKARQTGPGGRSL